MYVYCNNTVFKIVKIFTISKGHYMALYLSLNHECEFLSKEFLIIFDYKLSPNYNL